MRTSALKALAVLSALAAGMLISPSVAVAMPSAEADTFWIGGPDGSSVSDLISGALESQNRDQIAGVLQSMADKAAAGADVAFPGTQDLALEDRATMLTEAATAVSQQREIAADFGSREALEMEPIQEVPRMEPIPEHTDGDIAARAVYEFVGETPSDYVAYGSAIADNRAWQLTAGFNILLCSSSGCETTDRFEMRHTITPGQYTIYVDTHSIYFPDGGHFEAPGVEGSLYRPTAPKVSWGVTYPDTSRSWQFWTGGQSLWTDGTRIIVSIEQRIHASAGPEEQAGLYRTLTATCFSYPDYKCEWWV